MAKQDILVGQVWRRKVKFPPILPALVVILAVDAKNSNVVISSGYEITFDILLNAFDLDKNYG